MATYTNHSQHTHVDPNPVDDQVQARDGRTSPVLMGALAVALVALGVWWYAQRDDVAVDPQPAVTMVEPQLTTPAATETRPAGASGTRDNSGADRARAAIANRAPQPLAGNPVPAYPRSALRAGQEGAVMLRIDVDARGVPTDVQVVERSGDRDRAFDRAAIEAARQWRFQPATRNGEPVAATVQLPVEFRRG